MSKFNKYIIKLFIKYTVSVQLFVAIISLIANTFQHTKMLSEYNITFTTLIVYDMMKIPYLLYITMPMTIVISTMLVMVVLMKNNELLAYVSLGGKVRNLAIQFLISGVLISGLLYVSADIINPKTMLERERYSLEHIKKKPFSISGTLSDMWLKESDSNFVNITLMDPLRMELHDITEYHLDDSFRVDSIVTYDTAIFKENQWVLTNVKEYGMSPVPLLKEQQDKVLQQRSLFDELTSLPSLKPQYLSLKEIRRIVNIMKKQDLNASKYELQLYRTYAHSLSIIVIILVIFPLCIGFSRNHSYIMVATKSLFTGFGYWMLMASMQSLGKTGLFEPFTASFMPLLIFTVLAVTLIYRRERAL
ncbi:MAG: hypothetical protein C0602_03115 [Denitrovibrio sp.]|nr:MAG: hypothetical protein C0602_03115 [Denitrovibrio sp.]